MAKPNKQIIVLAIIKEIQNGKDRAKVLATAGKRWQISQRTFDRYWKIANQQHSELQDKAKKAADKVYIEASKKSAIEAVMTSQERKEVLTKIARGQLAVLVSNKNPVKKATEVIIPVDIIERIKAISELNKMEGDYAPTKVAQTDGKGNDIERKDLPQLSTEEIIQLLDKRNNP